MRLVLVGIGSAQHLRRQPPVGQQVDALEAGAPDGGHVAGQEQVRHHPLDGPPAPPAPRGHVGGQVEQGPILGLHLADRQRTAGPHLGEHLVHQVGVAGRGLADAGPRVLLGHAPAEQRLALDRVERGLVTPILEHLAARPQPPGQSGPVVRAQAGEEDQLVAAGQHVDRVDLHGGQPVEHLAKVPAVDPPGGPAVAEPLRRQGDAPGVERRDVHRPGHAEQST
jgi:hypothetical protein